MELVEGETLADRIAKGALPLDEAISIARPIADALEAAHEQGIIHRDLKPANVKVRSDGTVKVLDFGLAKAETRAGPGSGATDLLDSPTFTSPVMTVQGVILGTAAYMSPEQAAGKTVDRRTDIWAFGVVLMEMLTGRQTFGGETVSHVIASVLKDAPAWSSLPQGTPSAIRRLLRRCLDKDRHRRLADVADARLELDDAATQTADSPIPARLSPRRAALWAGVAAIAGALIAAVAVTSWLRPDRPEPERPARFVIAPPATTPLAYRSPSGNLAIAPDGSFIVYSVVIDNGQNTQFMIRAVDDLEARPLANTVNGTMPFVSPDGRAVGFVAGSGGIAFVPVSGGPELSMMKVGVGGTPRGATWGTGDRIVLGNANPEIGLYTVRIGGAPENLTRPDDAKGEVDHVFPSFLPGERAVLFTILDARPENAQIAVLDLATGRYKTLIRGSYGRYMAPGYVIFVSGGSLQAVRFDLERLQVVGEPMALGDRVIARATGAAEFAVSSNGTLVSIPERGGEAITPRSLVWLDRQGKEEPVGAPQRTYGTVRVSPDGSRAVVSLYDDSLDDLWIWNFARRTLERMARTPGADMSPLWDRRGRHVLFALASPGGGPTIFRQAADGTGSAEQLVPNQGFQYPTTMSPDGRRLLIQQTLGPAGRRIRALDLNVDGNGVEHEAVLVANAMSPEISPDGRWLAYQSNESGEDEVYVRPFPAVESGRVLVSTAGGTRPAWTPKGDELLYIDAKGLLTAVPLQVAGSAIKPGLPVTVSRTVYFPGVSALGVTPLRGFDVAPDGQRFLMIRETAEADQAGGLASVVVRLNVAEYLGATRWRQESLP
jgi:serine/threonine-protein kinase